MTAAAAVGHTGGRVLATEVFPAEMKSLSTIRAFAEKWGMKVGLTDEQVYGLKLAVSETCANAIEHPLEKSDLTLWAWDREDRFTVDVWHAGEFRVMARDDRPHRGMGLPLIVASVDELNVARLPEGGIRVSLTMFLKNVRSS